MYMLGRHKRSLVHQPGVQKLLVRVNILAYAAQAERRLELSCMKNIPIKLGGRNRHYFLFFRIKKLR
jgi:hypothetical protein